MSPRFAFLDHPGPIPMAHRGGSAEAPENTVAAFSHALSLGFRYLETDVRASSDGVVAVIHDPMLDRVSDRSGLIESLRWSELSDARLPDDQRIPRLDELLERWPEAHWNIDLKSDAVVGPLIEVLTRSGAIDRVCVTSFSDRRVAKVRRALGPRLCTGMGPRALTRLRLDSLIPPFVPLRPGFRAFGAAQVPLRSGLIPVVDRAFVDRSHRVGLAVHVWTIDDAPTMDRVLDLGVDGIITDRPTILRQVLDRRGSWESHGPQER